MNAQPGKAPIDPNIYVALERQGTAQVMVILQQQADLSGAARLRTKTEKGAFVYEQLTTIAAQTQGGLRAFLDSRGAEYRAYWIVNMLMVTVDAKLLDELARQPGVERLEGYTQPDVDSLEPSLGAGHDLGPDFGAEYGPFPPVAMIAQTLRSLGEYGMEFGPASPATVEWNIQRVGADDVWGLGFNGAGVVVGNLDSGVVWTHPALVNHYRPQIPGAPGRHDYNWWDGTGGSSVPLDYSWHGTITMGPIVGDDGAGNQIGMAPGAYWIACPGTASPNVNILDCFQFFLAPTDLNGNNPRPDLAPDVINNSWGSATDYHAAIQALYAAGIFFAHAAGNTGPACLTVLNPGQWPEVMTTGAFAQGDTIWAYSSRGPALIEREWVVKPDITSPGVLVRTCLPTGGYASGSGTSLAAPHITGAVALLISANPELRGKVDILQMLLKTSAEPKVSAACSPFVDVPNDVWGWGILNVYNAVLAAQALELGALEGQVYETGSLEPVSGAHFTFRDAVSNWPYVDTSDALGDYEYILPVGTYQVTATHYGYLDSVINNVNIGVGVTTTQDIEMFPAPTWNLSGVVTDSLTGEPLAASTDLEGTPLLTETDPETGAYSGEAAQGDWWLAVTSPGYAAEAVKITLDQDRVENFSLDPIINYYMRRSVDGGCGVPFIWMDAYSGGTYWDLDDEDYVTVPLPAGRTFTFYGNSYNTIYVGDNGVLTFGVGSRTYSVPLPNLTTPNNGIYAFSTDLSPWDPYGGFQGDIWTKYINNRYFVIEWYLVEHFPAGDPETFEIILDLDTNVIKIQYLTVSDATDVVVGVENSTGTEATQYAHNDPVLVANNTAVAFYPVFGAPPPSGGAGEMAGTVTDEDTGLPIEGALVTATAYTLGEIFTYTTGLTGTYSASLCADWYDVTANAYGYEPGVEVRTTVYPGAQTIQDFALTPITLTSVAITGPDEGWVSTPYTFTAAVEPISTSLPLTYTWQVDGQLPITHTAGLTDTATFNWDTPGMYTLTVNAANLHGAVSDTHTIAITPVSPCAVTLSGPESGLTATPYTFTAAIEPVSTTLSLTYTWQADGQLPITHTTGLTDVTSFSWDAPGIYAITVSAANEGGTVSDTHTITIAATTVSPSAVTLSGPESGQTGTAYTFTATVEPLSTTLPITYTWQADGQSPITRTAGLSDTVTFLWDAPGTYTITVQAANAAGTVSDTLTITIAAPTYRNYLPLIQRKQ